MNKVLKNKKCKFIIGIIAGVLVSITFVSASNNVLNASEIDYDNSNSTLTTTNIQHAIDELNAKANTDHFFVKKYLEYSGTPTNYICDSENVPTVESSTTAPEGHTLYVALYSDGQYGVCTNWYGDQNCFRVNNYINEAKHILDLFSEATCQSTEDYTQCEGANFICVSNKSGLIECRHTRSLATVTVNPDNTVSCNEVANTGY